MDIISPEKRSALMSRIKGKDTRIELEVRRGLHALGFRYRLKRKARLPGRPDIVLPRYRTVVFVHGCFWHGHNCHLFRWPKSRPDFWKQKITANRDRDRKVAGQLESLGWHVETVWECELRGQSPAHIGEVILALAMRIRTRGNE